MRVAVYVDGFNLYYGSVKGTRYHWLDLDSFSRRILHECERRFMPALSGCAISSIRYFTARVNATSEDPHQPERQAAYIRALQTIPHLSVHYGRFLSHPPQPPQEKGSDVNLAAHMLLDAFDDTHDVALLISNDSDLVPPVEIVRDRFQRVVITAMPVSSPIRKRYGSNQLRAASSYYFLINERARHLLRDSQFPDIVEGPAGLIEKPLRWRR